MKRRKREQLLARSAGRDFKRSNNLLIFVRVQMAAQIKRNDLDNSSAPAAKYTQIRNSVLHQVLSIAEVKNFELKVEFRVKHLDFRE